MSVSPLYTLTGNFESISGASTGYIQLELAGYYAQAPRVAGTGMIAQKFYQSPVGASFSVTLFANDQIVPGSTFYKISVFRGDGTPVFVNGNYRLTGSGTNDLSTLTSLDAVPPPIPVPSTVSAGLFFGGPANGGAAPATYRHPQPSDILGIDSIFWVGGDSPQQGPSSDLGAQINYVYNNLLPSTGGQIVIAAGTHNYSTPILLADGTVAHKTVRITGAGRWSTVLNYTPTTGTAFTLDVSNADQIGPALEYLTISGAGHGNSTVGFQLGSVNGGSGAFVNNLNVQGFGTGVRIGNLTFRTLFQQCWIGENGVTLSFPDLANPGAEQMVFSACSFNSNVGGLNSPVNLNGSMGDIIFNACSFDDAQLNVPLADALTPSKIVCYGCHFENPQHTTVPFIVLDSQSMVLDSCAFVNDVTGTDALAKFISVTGTTSPASATNLAIRQAGFLSNGGANSVTNAIVFESGAKNVVFNIENTQQFHDVRHLYTDNTDNSGSPGTFITPSSVLKKGTNAGNYTSASTSYVDVDATNLKLEVNIPIGSVLTINATGLVNSLTSVVPVLVSLLDGSTTLTQTAIVGPNTTNTAQFALSWQIVGDGLTHTIKLQFATTNASDSVNMSNASGFFPTMTFQLSQVQ